MATDTIGIIGAGIAGLATAWALTKRGVGVTLYEQGAGIPNPLSASGDEHRIIRRAYGAQGGYAQRIDEAYEQWESLFEDIGANHLISNGFLIISREPGDEAEAYRDGLLNGGHAIDLLGPTEAADRFKFLDRGTFRYAGFSPEGGALMCQRIARDTTKWLTARGADIRTKHQVTSIDTDIASITFATGETARHSALIVTAGAWILKLLPTLADTLTTYRTAVAYFTPPDDLAEAWNGAPVMLDFGGKSDGYGIPPLFGSGLKLGTANHKWPAEPDQNREPGADEADSIRKHFSSPLARLDDYTHEKTITCAYTFTRDTHFHCVRHGKTLVVSACSGHGYKFGAAIGNRVADAMIGGDVDTLKQWLEARDNSG